MSILRAQPDPTPRAAAEPKRPVILVADDDRDTREMYRSFFDLSGFQTAEAADGNQTLLMARQLRPDVLLTDLVLPDVDGLTVARMLKHDPGTAGIRVLLVTGYAFDGLERSAVIAGVERALIKPCLPQTMLREVKRALLRPAAAASENPVAGRHVLVRDQQHDGAASVINPQRQDI